MTRYTVKYGEAVWAAIQARVWHIAIDQRAPLNADRWFTRLRAAVESLESMPGRYAVDATQSDRAGTVVYRLVFERAYLILYTIDEANLVVNVVLFYHGAQARP